MCSKCFNENIYRFDSLAEFETFDKDLTLKLNKDLEALKSGDNYKQVYYDQFQCVHCKTIWNLSIPDNAWRGFFLDNESLKNHIDSIKKEDKIKGRIGCLIVISIIGLIIYLIVK